MMKKTGRILAAAVAAAMAVSLSACGGQAAAGGAAANSNPASAGSSGKVFTIGVAQLVTHPAMDAALKGFQDGLAQAGFKEGENVTYDIQNAQGEQSNCVTIANTFANKKPDLILAIATPAAQAVAKVITDTPVMITAVTDPEESKLVKSNKAPGGNISGTSDKTPVKDQIALIKEIIPNLKTVGIMYCSSETNSQIQAKWAQDACKELGLSSRDFTVSNSNEIQQVAQSMVGKVEAVYIPTDNMLASGMKNVVAVTNDAKLPIITGESGMVKNGGLCTVGINYEKLGFQTGTMAAKVLKGEAKPADLPIEYQEDYDISYNSETAKKLNITLPAKITAGTDMAAQK